MSAVASPLLQQQLLQALGSVLQSMPAQRYWVAYSGGVDSHVLLHAMAALRPQMVATLNAVHVNHGLNAAANGWAAHCIAVCDALEIPCHLFNIDAHAQKGESPEAAARDARYQAFSQLIKHGDCLLTAHHQEDQAETLLLQLLRGAGPHGLAAMPTLDSFAAGTVGRPLLALSQTQIEQYANAGALQWIDDPSNRNCRFARNYLRHEVIPKLKAHWPTLSRTLSRSAENCAEAAELLDQLAAEDLQQLTGWQQTQTIPATVPLQKLQEMVPKRRRNLLRYWIKKLELPIVSKKIMNQIEYSLVMARKDAMPLVKWPGGELRRSREELYAMAPLATFDTTTTLPWQWQRESLILPAGLGTLMAHTTAQTAGLSRSQCEQLPLTIRFRQGGERCRLAGRHHHHALKGLLQAAGVPPWQRDRIPLIYLGDQLAAVVGHFYCAPFQAEAGERAVTFAIA